MLETEGQSGKRKLLVLTSTFPRWEGDTTPPFVYELSRRLTNDFEVHVLAPHATGSRRYEERNGLRIHRYRYWLPRGRQLTDGAIVPNLKKYRLLWAQVPFFVAAQFLAALRIVRFENIDIVHAHWVLTSGLVAGTVRKLVRKPFGLVITTHGADIFGLGLADFLKKWTMNQADRLTVVSHAIKDEVLRMKVDPARLEVLPMGVDLTTFSPDRRNEQLRKDHNIEGPFLLFVGRLAEKKGVKYLIQAMPSILERYPTAKLLVIGEGPLRNTLQKLASGLQVLDHTQFLGAVSNARLPEYFATADVFVGPSVAADGGDAEGFGLVFVEAIGCGTIVIATDLPAISDIVIDGETGVTVPQKDARAIGDAAIRVLSDPEARLRVETRARQYVLERFDWALIGRRYRDLLKAVLPPR